MWSIESWPLEVRLSASTTYFVVSFLCRNGERRSHPWSHIDEETWQDLSCIGQDYDWKFACRYAWFQQSTFLALSMFYFAVTQNIRNNMMCCSMLYLESETLRNMFYSSSSVFQYNVLDRINIFFSTYTWQATRMVLVFSRLLITLQSSCTYVDCCLWRSIVSWYYPHIWMKLLRW